MDNPNRVRNPLTSLDGEVFAVTISAGTMMPLRDALGSTIKQVFSCELVVR